jgi:hypothetical protein
VVKVLNSFVRGPLEPYVAGFAEELSRLGYTRTSASQHICFIAHLDRWMLAQGIELAGLSGSVLARYLAERRAAGYVEYRSVKALQPLLAFLAPADLLPDEVVEPATPVEELLARYRNYLITERALTPHGTLLRGLPATVRGDPAEQRRTRARRDHRGRRDRLRAGGLSGPGGRVGEADRVRAAIAVALAAPDRADPDGVGAGGSLGGGLATVWPAEGFGTC